MCMWVGMGGCGGKISVAALHAHLHMCMCVDMGVLRSKISIAAINVYNYIVCMCVGGYGGL